MKSRANEKNERVARPVNAARSEGTVDASWVASTSTNRPRARSACSAGRLLAALCARSESTRSTKAGWRVLAGAARARGGGGGRRGRGAGGGGGGGAGGGGGGFGRGLRRGGGGGAGRSR